MAGCLVVVGTGHARDTSAARWLFLRQPCRAGWFWLPLRGSFLRPSAAGIARGGIPLRTPQARVPADPCLPKPIEHTRPRGIHAPGHSFGVIQTMLLALPNFGLERMGRAKQQQLEKLMRPAAGNNQIWVLVLRA